MNKKTIALLLAAFTAAALTAQAQTSSPSWVVTGSAASQYMFRGVRLGGPSFQPSIEYDSGPAAVGVWANFPMSSRVVGQSDPEFDVYGSYSIETVKDTLAIVPGFTLYTYPSANRSNGFYKTTIEPNLALNYTVNGLKLTPKVYYDFILKGATVELGAAYTVPLKSMGTELDFSATGGMYYWSNAVPDVTPQIKNWAKYVQAGVTLPFQVSKDSKFSIGWNYVKGSSNYFKQGSAPRATNTAAVARGVVTLSYAVTM